VTEAEIRDAVLRVLHGIAPEIDLATLEATANLREEADLDSFDFLNFVVRLGEALHVEFAETEFARLTTIDQIVANVAARQKSGPARPDRNGALF